MTAPYRAVASRRVATLALVVVATVGTGAWSCLGPRRAPDPPPDPVATVVATRTERNGAGDPRVAATVEDATGDRWTVRLPADTACVVGAQYPKCAGG